MACKTKAITMSQLTIFFLLCLKNIWVIGHPKMWTCGTKLQTLKSASRILGQIYIYCIRAPFFSHTQPFLYHDTHFSNHFHYPSLTKQYSSTSQLGTVSHPIPLIHQVTYDHGHSSLLESSQNTIVNLSQEVHILPFAFQAEPPCREPQITPSSHMKDVPVLAPPTSNIPASFLAL